MRTQSTDHSPQSSVQTQDSGHGTWDTGLKTFLPAIVKTTANGRGAQRPASGSTGCAPTSNPPQRGRWHCVARSPRGSMVSFRRSLGCLRHGAPFNFTHRPEVCVTEQYTQAGGLCHELFTQAGGLPRRSPRRSLGSLGLCHKTISTGGAAATTSGRPHHLIRRGLEIQQLALIGSARSLMCVAARFLILAAALFSLTQQHRPEVCATR